VHADITELDDAMAQECSEHKVKDKILHGPGDIKAHLGTYGRYYVLSSPEVHPDPPPRLTRQKRSFHWVDCFSTTRFDTSNASLVSNKHKLFSLVQRCIKTQEHMYYSHFVEGPQGSPQH
jgi:hypothetical protein